MPELHRSRSETMAYAASGMEPPPVVPLRKSDPRRAGPYQLESVLGSGGMGRVYLGRDTTGGTGIAAVKVIRPEYAEDPLFRKRFEREVGALDRVQGAHIVRLMGSGCDEDLVWVATEYIPGPTLSEVVTERGPIDSAAAWRLLADVGRAIEAIWRAGLVHRDLKPSNVILGADGARVIDFGVVQATDGTSITVTGQNVGTPAYMSPEQVRGREVTAASDVFSLASTLTYAVAGEAPFGEGTGVDVLHRVAFEPPREAALDKVAAVDAELGAFIRTCLDKDPERRPLPETVFRTAIGHQLSASATSPPRPAPKRPSIPAQRPAVLPAQRPAVLPSAPLAAPPADHTVEPGAPAAPAPKKRRALMVGAAAMTALLVAGGVTVALLDNGDDRTDGRTSAAPIPQTSPALTEAPAPAPSSSPEAATPSSSKADQAAEEPSAPTVTLDPSALDIRSDACPAAIARGAQGDCVKALQLLLAGYGLHVTVDGQFGAETVAAVKAFQTEAGAVVDGRAGAKTKALLYGQPRGPVRLGSLTVTESVNAVSVARCLAVGTGGLDAEVWGCKDTAAQRWGLYRVPGQDSQYIVVNQDSHRCLDAGGYQETVRVSNCDGQSSQRWRLGDSGASGGRTLVSVPEGFCMDAEAATSGKDGQRVQSWGCAGSTNQVWNWS
ncbi:protein kinase [Streptomyces sp. NBC_00038]|uniref:protein kinase domain-containing protein n=1 Tax=Streptomyces sp. NBC_00038 TaxID=2903615 RepID=UPI0022519226|nr:protein kinase [Streptomyces sp. NBC_00038]MCX5562519.1 protein kinase [Streptomyces sp. NBC_00038]